MAEETVESLKAQLIEKDKAAGKLSLSIEKLNADLEEALALNDELQKQLANVPKKTSRSVPSVTVKHEGKEYRITREKFYLNGHGEVTAAVAAGNKEIIEKLLKRQSPILQLI